MNNGPSTVPRWQGNETTASSAPLKPTDGLNGSSTNYYTDNSHRNTNNGEDGSFGYGDIDLAARVRQLEQQREELLEEIQDLEHDLSVAHKSTAPKQTVLANSCAVNFKALKQMRAYCNALENVVERANPSEEEEEELAERSDAASSALQSAFVQQMQLEQALNEMKETELLNQATRDPTADGTEESLVLHANELTEELQQQIDHLQKEIDTTKEEKSRMERNLIDTKYQVEQLQKELKGKEKQLEQQHSTSERETKLQQSLEKLENEKKSLETQWQHKEEENNTLRNAYEDQCKQNDELSSKCERIQQELDHHMRKVEERDRQLEDKDRELHQLRQSIRRGTDSGRLQQLEEEVKRHEVSKEQLQKDNKKLRSSLADLQSEVGRVDHRELDDVYHKLDHSSPRHTSPQMTEYVNTIDEMRQRLGELETRALRDSSGFSPSGEPASRSSNYNRAPITPSIHDKLSTLEKDLQILRSEIQPPNSAPGRSLEQGYSGYGNDDESMLQYIQNLKEQLYEQEERMRQIQEDKMEMSQRAKSALQDAETQLQQLVSSKYGHYRSDQDLRSSSVRNNMPGNYFGAPSTPGRPNSRSPRRIDSGENSRRRANSADRFSRSSPNHRNLYNEDFVESFSPGGRSSRQGHSPTSEPGHGRRGSFDSANSRQISDGPDTSLKGPLAGTTAAPPRIMRRNPHERTTNPRQSSFQERTLSNRTQPVKVQSSGSGSDAAAAAAKAAREAAEKVASLSHSRSYSHRHQHQYSS